MIIDRPFEDVLKEININMRCIEIIAGCRYVINVKGLI